MPIPSTKPGFIEGDAQTEGVSEPASIPAETPSPLKGATPPVASQTKINSPTIPLVISTNNPFVPLS